MVAKSPNALAEEIINIRQGLAIYKVNASPYWQARIWDRVKRKYIVRSTKETSRIQARKAAEELAASLSANEKRVEKEYTIAYYADRLIKKGQRQIANGERNSNYVRTIRLCLENKQWGLLKAFPNQDVRLLTTRIYQEFMEQLEEKRPDLSTSTLNTLSATFRNILKIARDDGVIDRVPDTPRRKQKDNPRSYFPFHPLVAKEDDVYQQVLLAAKTLAKGGEVVRGVPITDELYDLILFVTHSFVRPIISELYELRHGDVTVTGKPRHLQLTIRDGKTGFRIAVTMQAAVSVFERIKKRNPDAKPTDYLFFPGYSNRETAGKIVQRQFRKVLKEAGLWEAGKSRYTIYSLRHTAICMRLVRSHGEVNIYSLAKNAGTSVEQIERFYAKNLPLSPELVRNLQHFGEKKSSKAMS